jgi:hypothetical protein
VQWRILIKNRLKKWLVGFVLVILSSTFFQVPMDSAKAETPDWLEEGNYFIFEIVTNFTSPEFYNETVAVNVSIEDVTSNNVTQWEVWFHPDNKSGIVEGGSTFNLTTREAEGYPGYYSWLWINPEDLENNTIYIADKVAHLKETTQDYYILNYSESSGNESTLSYGRNDYRLALTDDFIYNANDTMCNSTTSLVTYGQGGGSRSSHGGSHEDDIVPYSGDPGPGTRGDLHFGDPYHSDAANWFKVIDRGLGGVWGSASANYATGYMYNYGWVGSGGGGRKQVYAYAKIKGPEVGYFQVSQSGRYDIRFYHKFSGEARTASSIGLPAGAGEAWGKVRHYDYLVDQVTSQQWHKRKTHYDCYTGSAIFLNKHCHKTWNNHYTTLVISNVYLYSYRTYYFYSRLVTEHSVHSFGAWAGTSWSWLEDDFYHVMVDKR